MFSQGGAPGLKAASVQRGIRASSLRAPAPTARACDMRGAVARTARLERRRKTRSLAECGMGGAVWVWGCHVAGGDGRD
jgi:hypothetical protein